jgi:hypothetical protein
VSTNLKFPATPPILVDNFDVAVQKKDEKARFVQTPGHPESPVVILFRWKIKEVPGDAR